MWATLIALAVGIRPLSAESVLVPKLSRLTKHTSWISLDQSLKESGKFRLVDHLGFDQRTKVVKRTCCLISDFGIVVRAPDQYG